MSQQYRLSFYKTNNILFIFSAPPIMHSFSLSSSYILLTANLKNPMTCLKREGGLFESRNWKEAALLFLLDCTQRISIMKNILWFNKATVYHIILRGLDKRAALHTTHCFLPLWRLVSTGFQQGGWSQPPWFQWW